MHLEANKTVSAYKIDRISPIGEILDNRLHHYSSLLGMASPEARRVVVAQLKLKPNAESAVFGAVTIEDSRDAIRDP
jgi:hypothetical protein